MKKKIYITTPIYYVNGNPHVGHAHTSVMGDILKREFIMNGYDVYFTTGVDEHGQKNQIAIENSGLSAKEYLDGQSKIFSNLFDLLNVEYDHFVRTTDDNHKKAVQHVLNIVNDKDLIVKKEYQGLYCLGCEMFKTTTDLTKDGLCADHQTKPVMMKETNYFFKLSNYQDWLIDYIKNHPDWIQPKHYANEILHLLEEPLPDLCISRTKERCTLGVELPFDTDYVAYVWFDALINYISNLGYPDNKTTFLDYWGTSTHLMAKDIIKTHCIYWPIMLKAIGIEPQHRNFIHGYWTGAAGIKMSKSIGNVVDPFRVIEMYGVDPFRYFLARTMGETDSSMSYELIKNCYNYELVNTISNGLYRTIKLANKVFDGVYPNVSEFSDEDLLFLDTVFDEAKSILMQQPSLNQIYNRAQKVYDIAKLINLHFDKRAPWILANHINKNEFNSCIMTCLEALRIMAETAYPIIPTTSEKILSSLGIKPQWDNYKLKKHVLQQDKAFAKPHILFQRKE